MALEIKKPLRKFMQHLLQAQRDNLNEADTVTRLIKFFEDVLGYDSMTEISREAQLKNKYVDIALKTDGVTRMLVEAKAAGVTLRDRHIEQAESYAARNNFRWVILTNGVVWKLYHLTFEEGIDHQLAFDIDLSKPDDFERALSLFTLLHRDSVRKGELEEYWKHATALNPASVGAALFQESTLRLLRREIRRGEGLLVDIEDLRDALHKMLSPEVREQIGPPKIRRPRGKRKMSEKQGRSGGEVDTTEPHDDGPDGEKPPRQAGDEELK